MDICPRLIAVCALFALVAACASPYEKFYHPSQVSAGTITPPSGNPKIVASAGNASRDILNMYEDGYTLVGNSAFVGRVQGEGGAIAQAKKVGAAVVILYSKYRNTETGQIPITTPTATTGYTSGTVNAIGPAGSGFATYAGTTTVYGTETTMVPYSVDKYDQAALYFAPLQRKGLGVLVGKLTDDQRRALGSNQGLNVLAIRKGSPAFVSNILPGDIISAVDGRSVYDVDTLRTAVDGAEGRTVEVAIFRSGAQIAKAVSIAW